MKKLLSVLLTFFFLSAFIGVAIAEERIVQLTIPGCAAWGGKNRIGTTLKNVKGVKKHEFKSNNLVIVTFDDEVTTINIIIDKLNKGKDKVSGDPVYLK